MAFGGRVKSKRLVQFVRVLLTLMVSGAIVWSLWDRVGPRLETLPVAARTPKPLDPAFLRMSPMEVAMLPLAVRFDAPMGSEHGALTYNAQPFRVTRHLGDDLNGIGGQNSDLGDPVRAAGAGKVVYAGVPGEGWGKMVIIAHRVPEADSETGDRARIYQTVYAHLAEMSVRRDQVVSRGDPIGTVGTAEGKYLAHLHFEVREGPYVNPSVGYADSGLNRVSPEKFLADHRGARAELLNPPPGTGVVEVEMISGGN